MRAVGSGSGRVVLATYGSPGDLNPYLAIGRELARRGHPVAIATSACHAARVAAAGLECRPVRPDRDPDRPDPDLIERVRHGLRSPAAVFREMFMPELEASYHDLVAATADADLLVSHTLAFAAPLVAETTGVAWASAVVQPLGFFSGYDPPVLGPPALVEALRRAGPNATRPAIRAAKGATGPWTRPWHDLRRTLGLPVVRTNPVFAGQHSPRLVLALFSPLLGRPQPDWPAHVVVCGFPFPDAERPPLPDALRAFLDAGPPPVVFTLGTTAVNDAGRFYEVSAGAAAAVGRRAVLVTGRDPANRPSGLPDGMVAVPWAAYESLFPLAEAIVHQAGIGTLSRAMEAGKPMLAMPYAHDQPDNAARARRLGIARVVPRRRYATERVAQELAVLLGLGRYAERAAAVGAAVRREAGVATACEAIEALLDGRADGA